MSTAYTLYQLLRERAFILARVAELEKHLDLYLDRDAAVRELDSNCVALAAVDDAVAALASRPEDRLADPKFDSTPEKAAALLGIDRRELLRLIDLTDPADRPCIDVSPGGVRRHLRFNKSQLERWAQEKPWQASVPTRTAGSSGGGSPPRLTLVPASSGPGSAPSPRPARKSTARRPSAPRRPESGGFLPTGDPDLDALL